MQVIGIRKMLVIMSCVAGITYIVCSKDVIDNATAYCISLIAALGGFHVSKQGQIDEKRKP